MSTPPVHAIAPNEGSRPRTLCGGPEARGEIFRSARDPEFVTCVECIILAATAEAEGS